MQKFDPAYFKKFFYNTSWLMVERIVNLIMLFIIGVLMARYLGPQNYGLLNYAMSFVLLFAVFESLGLEGVVIRDLLAMPEKQNVLLGSAFFLKMIGAFLAFGLIFIFVQFTVHDQLTASLILIMAAGVFFPMFNVIDFYYQSRVASKFVVFAKCTQTMLSFIIKLIIILNQSSLLWFALVIPVDSFLLALGLVGIYLSQGHSLLKWKFDMEVAKGLLKTSFPLILSGVAISIYMRIDQLMIKSILGDQAVGIYSVAVRICEVWYFIPMAIASSLFPAIISAKKIDEKLYHSRLQQFFDLMVVISVIILIPFLLWGDQMVLLLFGQEFAGAGAVLKIYMCAGTFTYMGVASSKWLLSENLTRISFYRTFSGLIVNIFLNLILINRFGVCGAAFATLITQIVATYLFDLCDRKTRFMFKMKSKSLFFYNVLRGRLYVR